MYSRLKIQAAMFIGVILTIFYGCAATRPSIQNSPYQIELKTSENKLFQFSDLYGKVTLVTFTATWCFPCMTQIPLLINMQNIYARYGFKIVAVGMDLEGAAVLKPFAETYQLPFPVLIADNQIRLGQTPFGFISQVPTNFIFDRQGRQVAAWTGPVDPASLDDLISNLVKASKH